MGGAWTSCWAIDKTDAADVLSHRILCLCLAKVTYAFGASLISSATPGLAVTCHLLLLWWWWWWYVGRSGGERRRVTLAEMMVGPAGGGGCGLRSIG